MREKNSCVFLKPNTTGSLRREPAISKVRSHPPPNTKLRPLCFFKKITFSTVQMDGRMKKFIYYYRIASTLRRMGQSYFYFLYKKIVKRPLAWAKKIIYVNNFYLQRAGRFETKGPLPITKLRPLCFFKKITFSTIQMVGESKKIFI